PDDHVARTVGEPSGPRTPGSAPRPRGGDMGAPARCAGAAPRPAGRYPTSATCRARGDDGQGGGTALAGCGQVCRGGARMPSFRVGAIQIEVILDALQREEPTKFFVGVPRSAWRDLVTPDADGLLLMPVQCLLVRVGERLAVV